jgi:hypothetical protein
MPRFIVQHIIGILSICLSVLLQILHSIGIEAGYKWRRIIFAPHLPVVFYAINIVANQLVCDESCLPH